MNVLVIDDTKNIRLLLTKCLELEGYSVTTAANGTEALALIAEKRFDLIFLDVRMPEISGTEVLHRIRELGIHTPVIMITAFGTVKNAVECTQLGAVAYLQKPFTENKVKQVLAEVLHFKPEGSSLDRILKAAEGHINNGRYTDAETMLKNSMNAYPLDSRVYLLLSKAYEGLSMKDEAKKCADIAVILKT